MKLKRPNRWGTKSISEQRTDLGIVRSSGVGDSVEIMLPTAQQDIDMAYDEALMALKTVSIFSNHASGLSIYTKLSGPK